MTSVTFYSQKNRLVGFRAAGHSGYASAGTDIVCAAITSAFRLVEATLNDVLGLNAAVRIRESDAMLSLRLPAALPENAEETAQALLAGLLLYLTQLHDEYPEHIEVMEED